MAYASLIGKGLFRIRLAPFAIVSVTPELARCLKPIGGNEVLSAKEDIDEYMQLILSGENDEECLKILSQKRKKALDKIHILEKQISNLDYLKNEIKNNN